MLAGWCSAWSSWHGSRDGGDSRERRCNLCQMPEVDSCDGDGDGDGDGSGGSRNHWGKWRDGRCCIEGGRECIGCIVRLPLAEPVAAPISDRSSFSMVVCLVWFGVVGFA